MTPNGSLLLKWKGHKTHGFQRTKIFDCTLFDTEVQTGNKNCSDEKHNDRGNKYTFQLRFCRNIICSCKVANPSCHPNKLQYTQWPLCDFIQYSAGTSYTHCKLYVFFPQISWLHPHLGILHSLSLPNS
jgi:hypothetical protein